MDGSWYMSRPGTRPRRHPEHLIRAQSATPSGGDRLPRARPALIATAPTRPNWSAISGRTCSGRTGTPAFAVTRLLATPETRIGEALLDQRNLAGIGNLYKCEVLFIERVNPWTPTGDVADLPRLVATAHG